MRTATLLLLGSVVLAGTAVAAPQTYVLPEETAKLAPGPHEDTAAVCLTCHSAEYVSTQPKMANPRAFWTAEVAKMKAVYGAPLDPATMPEIVDYLVATYGK